MYKYKHSTQQESPSPFITEVKLEEVVGDLSATLAGEDKHGVTRDGQRKVAACWRNVTGLVHLHSSHSGIWNLTLYSAENQNTMKNHSGDFYSVLV